jgi:hypothetical protein
MKYIFFIELYKHSVEHIIPLPVQLQYGDGPAVIRVHGVEENLQKTGKRNHFNFSNIASAKQAAYIMKGKLSSSHNVTKFVGFSHFSFLGEGGVELFFFRDSFLRIFKSSVKITVRLFFIKLFCLIES